MHPLLLTFCGVSDLITFSALSQVRSSVVEIASLWAPQNWKSMYASSCIFKTVRWQQCIRCWMPNLVFIMYVWSVIIKNNCVFRTMDVCLDCLWTPGRWISLQRVFPSGCMAENFYHTFAASFDCAHVKGSVRHWEETREAGRYLRGRPFGFGFAFLSWQRTCWGWIPTLCSRFVSWYAVIQMLRILAFYIIINFALIYLMYMLSSENSGCEALSFNCRALNCFDSWTSTRAMPLRYPASFDAVRCLSH